MTDDDGLAEFGTVRWFGRSWFAPICDPRSHVDTPVGARCARCDMKVTDRDRGVTIPYSSGKTRIPWHLNCWLHELGIADLVDQQAVRDLPGL